MDLDGWRLKLFYGLWRNKLGTDFPSRRGHKNIVPHEWNKILRKVNLLIQCIRETGHGT
jgi:hypothetical protein